MQGEKWKGQRERRKRGMRKRSQEIKEEEGSGWTESKEGEINSARPDSIMSNQMNLNEFCSINSHRLQTALMKNSSQTCCKRTIHVSKYLKRLTHLYILNRQYPYRQFGVKTNNCVFCDWNIDHLFVQCTDVHHWLRPKFFSLKTFL